MSQCFSYHRAAIITASLIALFAAHAAHAQTIIFDNSSQQNGQTNRGPGSSPTTFISNVSAPTTINNIEVLTVVTTAGNLKFLIFNHAIATLLFASAPKAFAADMPGVFTFKQSDPFAFTLLPGTQYDIGAISDVNVNYRYIFPALGFTQSGITSNGPNGNVNSFTTPVLNPSSGSVDVVLRLDQTASTVPEPGSLALLAGLCGTGCAFAVSRLRRRKK